MFSRLAEHFNHVLNMCVASMVTTFDDLEQLKIKIPCCIASYITEQQVKTEAGEAATSVWQPLQAV